MRSFLMTFAAAVSVVTALGGCSSKTSDQASDNQAAAPASGGQPGKQAGTSSEVDKVLDKPINPAEDGIINIDAKAGGDQPTAAAQ